jgi:thymidylate synthase|tara:strand:- start:6763 stop:7431 length:669 start_codon:yes stop_codon:yes gene_type:complete
MTKNVADIRKDLKAKLDNKEFVIDKTGVKTIELLGVSFIADEPFIFRETNEDYVKREIEWYQSMSLYVEDIPGETPQIWNDVSSKHGRINSNYGYLCAHPDNGSQFMQCVDTLCKDLNSRRAMMIYTRPSIQTDYNTDGMSDFICTNAVQYIVRENRVNAIVQMRSNDAVFGYNNDFAFQKYMLDEVVKSLNERYNGMLSAGDITWQVGSMHCYSRHFKFVK